MIKYPIEVKNVNFSYDNHLNVVKDVSFSVGKGSYTSLIGHNGSGKSTIAKLIIGLLEKDKGSILIDGEEMSLETIENIRSKIGIVFQNPDNQFIGATVRDDIAFGLENQRIPSEEMDMIIERTARQVGMQDYLDHEPTRLSGGQKQRVAIAGILAMRPDILILDEATSMLDPKGKEDINQLVKELHEENQMTILSITHDIEEVMKSDHVMVMHEGQIVLNGHPSTVMMDEAALIKMKLDAPFSVKLKHRLEKYGIQTGDAWNEERMVEALCQLLLNK